jgi:hypothetical protein
VLAALTGAALSVHRPELTATGAAFERAAVHAALARFAADNHGREPVDHSCSSIGFAT